MELLVKIAILGLVLAVIDLTDGLCWYNRFKCRARGKCIPNKLRCDGIWACSDGSDEENCRACNGGAFNCRDGSCIPLSEMCNGLPTCRSDIHNLNCRKCREGAFRCHTGQCITELKRCDGITDCLDGSDEQDCKVCKAGGFRCGNGTCISALNTCNGKNECGDGSTDENCPEGCTDGAFHCDGRKCMDPVAVCDGNQQCQNGKFSCPECPLGYFTCSDGECVSWRICDGMEHCRDGTQVDCDPLVFRTEVTERTHLDGGTNCHPDENCTHQESGTEVTEPTHPDDGTTCHPGENCTLESITEDLAPTHPDGGTNCHQGENCTHLESTTEDLSSTHPDEGANCHPDENCTHPEYNSNLQKSSSIGIVYCQNDTYLDNCTHFLEVAEKTGLPQWGLALIALILSVVALSSICVCACIFWRLKRSYYITEPEDGQIVQLTPRKNMDDSKSSSTQSE